MARVPPANSVAIAWKTHDQFCWESSWPQMPEFAHVDPTKILIWNLSAPWIHRLIIMLTAKFIQFDELMSLFHTHTHAYTSAHARCECAYSFFALIFDIQTAVAPENNNDRPKIVDVRQPARLGFWFSLNPQHAVHVCGVKRRTNLQRVHNSHNSCWETNESHKHIGQLAAPSQRWRGCHQSQFNIKQPDLKVYDENLKTYSNKQVMQHLIKLIV